ncbi:MAG: hypothetical protein P9E24_08645 [Candidatus Competibacter sp.]|nr:hypothetical protein [Candidatus Competibacter sp.]MDG4585133.1 hypothetical protein [Candidatus Competibacter sp.]
MSAIRHWILAGAVAGGMLLVPPHNANAERPYGGGYNGSGHRGNPGGYHGGGRPGYHGGYRGGYRGGYHGGCWNCGAAGAAVIGLAIGALVGSAIADAAAPPVAIGPPEPPPTGGCASVFVNGVSYYNCDNYGYDYGYGYNPRPNYYGYYGNRYGGRGDGWQAK